MDALLLLVLLIVINGAFAMTEIALLTARRTRLKAMVDAGDMAAALALALNEHPTRVLSTIQVGITSIGVLSGIVGEAAMAKPLSILLQSYGLDAEWAGIAATGTVVIVVTYFAIVVGELVPKRVGQLNPEAIARRVARPINAIAFIAHPFVRLLSASTDFLLSIIGVRQGAESQVTEEEVHALIQEGSDLGVFDEAERTMVRNVFRLDDRQIASFMTPRSAIVFLDLQDDRETNVKRILDSHHAQFPLCRGGLENVLGIVSARQLVEQSLRDGRIDFEQAVQPATFVPESLTGKELLENFRTSIARAALVIDEYGDVEGLVTTHDLFEAIAGEFSADRPEDNWAVQRQDGSWLIDGMIPIQELKDRLGLTKVPSEGSGRYHTLAGMLMLMIGRVPRTADASEWEGWRFEIVDMDTNRIDKVLAQRLPESGDEKCG